MTASRPDESSSPDSTASQAQPPVASPATAPAAIAASSKPQSPPPPPPPPPPPSRSSSGAPAQRGVWGALSVVLLVLALLVAAGAGWQGWQAGQRVTQVERELARRQQDTAAQVVEARGAAAQAQSAVVDVAARLAAVEGRLADMALQRAQLDELIAKLSRSREDNLLVDIEAAVRLAAQQAQVTGSAEPLLLALQQADERIVRAGQSQLQTVRDAIARDLTRLRTTAITNVPRLALNLDELMRQVDELPLRSTLTREMMAAAPAPASTQTDGPAQGASTGAGEAAPAAAQDGEPWWSMARWQARWQSSWQLLRDAVGGPTQDLLRVTRIDQPDAVLLAPEQAFFLRENLKLKLLNARLALLARQYDMAQADLRLVESSLEKYFVVTSQRTQRALTGLREVMAQAQPSDVPRPDHTLAALAGAAALR